jgi:ribonuclease III
MHMHELEQRLGYVFSSRELLSQALTHRSFGQPHNERLEFLGDSVLNCAIASYIFEQHKEMSEGELSRLRANLVNQSVLSGIATELGVGLLLRLGEGELKTGGVSRPSILADALEALLGAIFLDSGFDRAAATVTRLFSTRLDDADSDLPRKDPKTALQEWLQARSFPLPRYIIQRIEGEAHRQIFHVCCELPSQEIVVTGDGASRRIAEQSAAAKALTLLPTSRVNRKNDSGI